MRIRRAQREDNEAICQLMESVSMGESIELVFERRPDYFLGAAVQSEEIEVYVLTDRSVVVGVFSIGVRSVYVHGVVQKVRYLCDLRLHFNYRSGLQLVRGYRYIHDHILSEGEIMQTLILKDNQHAIRMLTSGRAGLPRYQACGEYLTYFIPKQTLTKQRDEVSVRCAIPSDVPHMSACYLQLASQRQFAPVVEFGQIGHGAHYPGLKISDFLVAERNGEIIGLCALWNQSKIRRIRVKAYRSTLLRWGRLLLNLFSKIALPPTGEAIQAVYLYAFTVAEEEVGRQLLSSVMESMPKEQLLIAGMDQADPMRGLFDGLFARKEEGLHYVVGYGDVARPKGVFAFEVARI